MGFINFRLYSSLNLVYPPKVSFPLSSLKCYLLHGSSPCAPALEGSTMCAGPFKVTPCAALTFFLLLSSWTARPAGRCWRGRTMATTPWTLRATWRWDGALRGHREHLDWGCFREGVNQYWSRCRSVCRYDIDYNDNILCWYPWLLECASAGLFLRGTRGVTVYVFVLNRIGMDGFVHGFTENTRYKTNSVTFFSNGLRLPSL